ncbi:MAG: UDP-N-acetylmuramate--L-alanine ligase [Ruminococcus sp.]|nr:UDP-N-acetylmuramate--L-alanine ligase [Ruminococcus sp.]
MVNLYKLFSIKLKRNDIILKENILEGKKHIHFIGIGGSGMYPLAQILHAKGYYITGSDNNETETLDAVRKMGIPVFLGQCAENIEGADLIVHTAAIMPDNPELIASKASGVPVLERSDLLGLVTSWYNNAICVSGTHGKTTTTSMITQILHTQNIDISAFIGGKLPCIGGSGKSGSSDILVCEACEFVDTFLKLYPDTSVILNIDADHLDYFKTLDNIIASFRKFAEKTTKTLIVNADDANTMKAVDGITGKNIITFGTDSSCDYYPQNICRQGGAVTTYELMHKGEKLCDITLRVPGTHNIINSVAAAAAAHNAGADPEFIAKGLSEFGGAKRRFEIIGQKNGITVADDYAHHPAELSVTLSAAMQMGYKNVWAVFQPFTFSRTSILLDDFAAALSIPDKAVLTNIMGSREKNTYNIFTKDLADKIPGCIYFDKDKTAVQTNECKQEDFDRITDFLCANASSGDLIITLGCGDVYKVAKAVFEKL